MSGSLCTLCPRNCGADRLSGNKGICQTAGEGILLSRAALHFWEEPCISGENGSGTVFFAGCPLHCIYCQNQAISNGEGGKMVSEDRLVKIFFELKEKGANNINLVTPTHYSDRIVSAIKKARSEGFYLPFVYNCSGYESVETLKMLDGLIDIYLTDFKYAETELAKDLSFAEDYPEIAKKALREMVRQQPTCEFDTRGIMTKGVIVRHLLLPGHVKNAKAVVKLVADQYKDQVYLSLMNQYTPVKNFENYPYLNRRVTPREYEKLIDYTLSLGIEYAFIQEGETAEESFIPPFDGEGI